jgi:hypothetical protein
MLNAAESPWEAGITNLSLLLPSEQERHLGFKPTEGEGTIEEADQRWRLREVSFNAETRALTDIPHTYDLRDVAGRNFVTPIKDQKDCRSSVSFGTVATVESQIRIYLNNPNFAVDLSEAHMFFVMDMILVLPVKRVGPLIRPLRLLKAKASLMNHVILTILVFPREIAEACAQIGQQAQ